MRYLTRAGRTERTGEFSSWRRAGMEEFLRLCIQLPAAPPASTKSHRFRPSCVQNPNTGCAVKGLPGQTRRTCPLKSRSSVYEADLPPHTPTGKHLAFWLPGWTCGDRSIAVHLGLWTPPTRECSLPCVAQGVRRRSVGVSIGWKLVTDVTGCLSQLDFGGVLRCQTRL